MAQNERIRAGRDSSPIGCCPPAVHDRTTTHAAHTAQSVHAIGQFLVRIPSLLL